MPKANKTCYCCGREYYYCPSCSGERKDPRIYTMWDSELCMEIFNLLTNESLKKITTLECKKKLIELGVDENTVLKDSVRKHVNRVMSYKEEIMKEVEIDVKEETSIVLEKNSQSEEKIVDVFDDKSITKIEVDETDYVENEIVETEPVVIESVTIETESNTENIKKTKRTKKSSVKNKENSEVD